MSWHVAPFVAKTKEAAIKHVEAVYEGQKQHFPKEAKDSIVASIECFRIPEGKVLLVKSAFGHVDGYSGNASVDMMTVDAVGL